MNSPDLSDQKAVDLSPEATAKSGVILSSLDWINNWSRSNSVWPLQFGLACCAIEMIGTAGSRHDIARFGAEVFRPSPRQSDLMIVSGTVTKKMAPQVVRIYNQMPRAQVRHRNGGLRHIGGTLQTRIQRAQGD